MLTVLTNCFICEDKMTGCVRHPAISNHNLTYEEVNAMANHLVSIVPKKIKTICVLFLIIFQMFLISCAHDSWTKADTALLTAGLGLKTVDYLQTKEIVRNPNYWETNPGLGENPKQNYVDLWFLGGAIIQGGVAWLLPSDWRKVWLGAWIGISGTCVIHNHRIGVRP